MDKRFLYGTFSTAMMLFAVAIFVFVNLLAGEFNFARDLTAEQIFTLTPETHDFLDGLDEDVTLTFVAPVGQEHATFLGNIIGRLLDEYAAASSHISTQTRDPIFSPDLMHRFAAEADVLGGIVENSVVIESGGETRVILPHEMLERPPGVGINIEREITRAIDHVTRGVTGVIYYVTGSGEPPLPDEFIEFLENENYDVREVNLVRDDVPDDADILFILMPMRDWTEIKAARISDFLEAEGNAFLALDYMHEPMPNLAAVLDEYGLALTGRFVMENDTENHLDLRGRGIGLAVYLLPEVAPHEIMDAVILHRFVNALPFFPAELQTQAVRRTTLTIEPLWTTSRDAFTVIFDEEAGDIVREPSETAPPFNHAVAVTDRIFLAGNAYYTRLVVTNNIEFIGPLYAAITNEGNWHFILNSLRWMQEEPPAVWIPPRIPPGHTPVFFDGLSAGIISVLAIGGIPLFCVLIGTAVWLKRRFG